MLPVVVTRKVKPEAAKIEVYNIFCPGGNVAYTLLSQISDTLHGKTLNICHGLRSSF